MKKLFPLVLFIASALSLSAQTVTFSVPIVPCNNNGVLTANTTGFTPPLSVTWITEGTTGTTTTMTVTGTSASLTSYSGGPVTVFVSDGVSSVYNTYGGMPPINYTFATTDAICPSLGTVSATASGGTAPYTYKWFDKSTGSIVSVANPASLPTGRYGIIVSDAAGCVYSSRVRTEVIDVNYTSFTATVTSTPANCNDGTAAVVAIPPSAVLPVSYHWSNGAATSTITGLHKGIYSVEIVDAAGCKSNTNPGGVYRPHYVNVGQSVTITNPYTATPATCTSSDGAAACFPSGGTAPYSFLWSNGATTSSQSGLPSGQYMVTITDANGCTGEDTMLIGTATPISVTSSTSPSLCTSATGNASVVPVGGTPPYSVMWYTSPMQASATATALTAGNYTFRVTDALGCMRTGTVIVPPVNTINATFTSTSPLCTTANGSITVAPTGGAAPYSYLWNTSMTTPTIGSLTAGNYSVKVTDAMGCKTTVAFPLSAYSPVHAGLSVLPATCIFNNDGAITATPFGGTPPYSYGWSTGGSTNTISALNSGLYSVNVTDATGCTTNENTSVGYDVTNTSCYCTIEGIVYNDANGNCAQDAGEYGIPHMQIYCSGKGYTYTDNSGHYSFMVPSGSYTITETVQGFYPLSSCQLNDVPVSTISGTGCVTSIDFANTATPVHNLRISTATVVPPVPGRAMVQRVTIVNEGTLTEDEASCTYKADGQLLAPWFTPSGIFGGMSNFYTSTGFPVLAPGASQSFEVAYNTPTNIPLNTVVSTVDTIGYNAASGSWLADYTPANNVCQHNTTVVSSFDPNFKEVTPKGTGPNGFIYSTDTVLEYSVHFQNTGNWYAQDIEVLDTLDSDLDWTTLHPVYESAPCKVSLYQSGALKVAKFTFSNINLPPQMFDDLRSNGMFTYTVKTMPGLAAGTQIKNRASIYFDFNKPILTNTTLNTINGGTPPIMVTNTTAHTQSFVVYPNPASSSFNAVINNDKNGAAMMNITDVTGKVLMNKTIALQQGTQTITTDISNFSAGIYFVNINVNGAIKTQKLVVIK